ncbi:hypothetical protein [Actinacidiphila glaucinigra]|uniref:hypothetical protein n=1 Tax=Actinacidiphila glaucinigra TaxID=235986 RepID=UPI0035D63563
MALAEIVVGAGIGTAFMPAFSLGAHGVEARDAGVASAMTSTAQQVGGSIGTALLNTVAAGATAGYLAAASRSPTGGAPGSWPWPRLSRTSPSTRAGPGRGRIIRRRIVRRGNAQDPELQHRE